MLLAHGLSSLPGISHGFFGREGGVSSLEYASLNVGPGSGDLVKNVRVNRSIMARSVGAASMEALISLCQVHSAKVVRVDQPFDWSNRPDGDAMVTKTPGLALCILTADCTPVLFADPDAGVIGACHAGWKGALGGVIENTLTSMCDLGADAGNISAATGPSLSPASFEVGPDLKTPFVEKHPWCEPLFQAGTDDRSQFDIWSFCEGVLLRCGVKSVDCVREDTLSQPDRYFSNRYKVRNELSDYGRNGSVIMLR
jgi:YfiH family protein